MPNSPMTILCKYKLLWQLGLCLILLMGLVFSQLKSSVAESKDFIKVIVNSPLVVKTPSTTCQVAICVELLRMINGARQTIDFAIYGLRGQTRILDALIMAQQRGVKIRGVIDENIDGTSYYADTHLLKKHLQYIQSDRQQDLETLKNLKQKYRGRDKYKDKCKRPEGHSGPLQCFEGKGYAAKQDILFRGDGMHNKFFIVDKKFIWTGSANISNTGTGGYNANAVAVIGSKYVASKYLVEFEQMFDGKFHRAKEKLKQADLKTTIGKQELTLFFSPQGYAVKRGVIPLIRGAKSTIDIAMFFLTHNNIAKELVMAQKRGVAVRVILDATAVQNGYSKHLYLRKHGIQVKVENWGGKMHMKSAVIDNQHLLVGSMNWTLAGASKNDENTIIVKNFEQVASYIDSYERMWASIPNQWLRNDPLPESHDSGASCFDGIDNDFNKLRDFADKNCKINP